ncbi:hypothetical protein SEA_BLUENGOLD_125 [Gordonia phage BlueNGold]|nr:hypothetical protein SEA_BLUENGOLD_125 [Gordonia phage BlueNGold]
MKIMITGMTARQVNEQSRDGFITLSGSLAKTLRKMGHDVVTKPYQIKDSLKGETGDFDLAFVGLGPLKGIGTAYMYEAVQAIHDYYGRLVLFVDDTDTKKMGREFKTVLKRPSDYNKPFFMYKREWSTLQDPKLFEKHMRTVEILAGHLGTYPPLLVPSWNFDLAYTAAVKLCTEAANNAITFDPSNDFSVDEGASRIERETLWGTTWDSTSTAINRMGVYRWDVETIPTYSKHRMSEVAGLLAPSSIWAPEITIATSVGTPVAADWRVLGPYLGPAFEVLPANIELMSEKERQNLAIEQKDALLSNSSDLPETVLEKLLGRFDPQLNTTTIDTES